MAKVTVNSVYAEGVWTTIDFVKGGENDVKIELVNNWMNRIIRDQKLPEKERIPCNFLQPYNGKSPLQSTGFFGPVKVISLMF